MYLIKICVVNIIFYDIMECLFNFTGLGRKLEKV